MGDDARDGLELMARTGFLAKGAVYLVLGLLGLRAAFGNGDSPDSKRAALIEILQAPLGSVLLTVVAFGLAWYALWRFTEAIADANGKGSDGKGIAARALYAVSGAIYGALAIDAASIVLNWSNDSGQIRSIFVRLLQGPVAVVFGLALAAYGLWQVWKAVSGDLSRQLDERKARREAGRWVVALSRFGMAARGVLFAVVGGWLIWHPASGPEMASSSATTTGSIRVLSRLPEGQLFLALGAAGLMAYGAYQIVHARYRRIDVPG